MSDLLTTTSEATARIHRIEADVEGATITITRKWSNLDATVVDTLLATLKAVLSYEDPLVDGQIYSGTFRHVRAWADWDDDRSVTIYQTIAPDTMYCYSSDSLAQDYLSSVVITHCEGLSETGLTAKLTAYAAAAYERGHVYRFSFRRGEDKLWSLDITDVTAIEREEAAYTSKNAFNVSETTQEIRNLEETTPPSAEDYDETNHTLHEVSARVNEFGRFDVVKKDTTKAIVETAITYDASKDTTKTVEDTLHLNVPKDNVNLTIDTPTDGKARSKVVTDYNPEFNVADVRDREESAIERTTEFTQEQAYDRTITKKITRNDTIVGDGLIDAAERVATANSVTIERVSGERTEFTNRGDVTIDTEVRNLKTGAMTAEVFEDASRLATQDVTLNKPVSDGVLVVDLNNTTAGTTKRATVTLDPAFRVANIEETTEVAKVQTVTSRVLKNTLDVVESLERKTSQAEADLPTADPSAIGSYKSLRIQQQPHGLIDYEKVTVEKQAATPAFTSVITNDSADNTTTLTITRGVRPDNVILTPNHESGVVKKIAVSSYDPDTATAIVLAETQTAKSIQAFDTERTHEQSVVVESDSAVGALLTSSYYRNREGLNDDVPVTSNTIKVVTQEPTRFGELFKTTIKTITPNYVRESVTYESTDGTTTLIVVRNATDTILAEDVAAYCTSTKKSSLRSSKNAFGLHDYSIESTVPSGNQDVWLTSALSWTKSVYQYRTIKVSGSFVSQHRTNIMGMTSRQLVGLKSALTYIDGGHPGSSYQYAGNNKYIAHRCATYTEGAWSNE